MSQKPIRYQLSVWLLDWLGIC